MKDDLTTPLVVDALDMATTRRRPGPGCIAHSDRGAQYTSVIYGQALATHGLEASMGKRGCAYDNAACESVMSTIKSEIDTINRGRPHPGRRAARLAVFDYIEAFYNRLRIHSALGYLSPEEFEQLHADETQPVEMPARRRSDQLGRTPHPTHLRCPRKRVKPKPKPKPTALSEALRAATRAAGVSPKASLNFKTGHGRAERRLLHGFPLDS